MEPLERRSWSMTGLPWLGASLRRTFRGMTVSKISPGKYRWTSVAHLGRHARAAVEHRQHDPADSEARVESFPDELDRLQQLREPLERVELALQRNEHPIGRDERVDGEEPQGRGQSMMVNPSSSAEAKAALSRLSRCSIPTSSISAPTRSMSEPGSRSRFDVRWAERLPEWLSIRGGRDRSSDGGPPSGRPGRWSRFPGGRDRR